MSPRPFAFQLPRRPEHERPPTRQWTRSQYSRKSSQGKFIWSYYLTNAQSASCEAITAFYLQGERDSWKVGLSWHFRWLQQNILLQCFFDCLCAFISMKCLKFISTSLCLGILFASVPKVANRRHRNFLDILQNDASFCLLGLTTVIFLTSSPPLLSFLS